MFDFKPWGRLRPGYMFLGCDTPRKNSFPDAGSMMVTQHAVPRSAANIPGPGFKKRRFKSFIVPKLGLGSWLSRDDHVIVILT
jgi:hypothetical protein